MSGPDNSIDRRSLFRVLYPERQRPTIVIGRHSYSVLDCAESGFRYEQLTGELPAVGSTLCGVIKLHHGTEVQVRGTVARLKERQVVIALGSNRIPFGHILREQQYMRTYAVKR